MKKSFVSVLMLATMLSSPVKAVTIFEAMGEAYTNNPTLQAQRAYLRSVDENVAIAKSGYRPSLYVQGDYSEVNTNDDLDTSSDGNTSKSISANLTQPLFSGFQTINSVKSADNTVLSEQNNLMNTEQDVLLNASTVYLNVLQNAAIVELQKNNEKLLKKRLDETLERFKVGEVTRTDVSQAKARYSSAKSDRISSEGDLEAAKAEYAQVVGSEPKDLSEPGEIDGFLPKDFNAAYEYAKANSYTLLRAQYALEAQKYDVKAKTGALLPSVNLEGSVAKTNQNPAGGFGEHTMDDVAVGVNFQMPLYEAGETRAKIRQSKYLKWQAQEQVLEAERQVRMEVKKAWEYMSTNKAQLKSIADQIVANEVALDGVQKEEALGNRTILDVLNAYQELLNSKVEEVKAKRNYYVASMNVLMAMGKLTAQDMKLNVDIYDAKKHYKETRDKWFSLSVDEK